MALLPSKARPAAPWAARNAGDDYGAHAQPDWREIDWRPHLRSTEIAGRGVRYVDIGSGDGPPIVFVHGLAGVWQNWLENIPRFAQERRVIVPDLPGFCDQLDLGEVVVIGNSMGGFVSAEVAIQFPERVERLVLVSAAGITVNSLRHGPVMAWGRAAAMAGARSVAEKRMVIRRPRLRHLAFGLITRHPSRIPAETLFEMSMGAGRRGFLPALEAHLDYDFRERLPEIRCPTLIVWGEDDVIIPARDADEYERSIKGSRKIVFDDTGHVPMIERPVTFNDCVLEFLREPRRRQTEDVGEPTAGARA